LDTEWHLRTGNSGQRFFDLDTVLPTVTKVVEIIECPLSAQRLDQRFTDFRIHRRSPAIRIRNTVLLASNFKLMQMTNTQAHDGLDDMVQFAKGDVFRHREPTPDLRSDPLQLDMQQQQIRCRFW